MKRLSWIWYLIENWVKVFLFNEVKWVFVLLCWTWRGHRIYSMPIVSQLSEHKFISTDWQLKARNDFHSSSISFQFNAQRSQQYEFLSRFVLKFVSNDERFLLVSAIHDSHLIDLELIKLRGRIEREFLIKICIFYGDPIL